MASKQRVKGFTYERHLVAQFNDLNSVYAERMWGSNGATRGYPQEVDIMVDYFGLTLTAQAKNWKWESYPKGFRTFCGDILKNVDMGIIKREGCKVGKSLVVMELDTLIKIINASDTDELNANART